jgi:acyl transferase domain-containing protein
MTNAPIAIVGIATELPSGTNADHNLSHDEFHEFLMAGKDSYERMPADRMNVEAWTGRGVGLTMTQKGSFLKDIGLFDPAEFGIAAKDARTFAVGVRRLVELSFLALLDSGIDYRGRNVGCYATAITTNIEDFADVGEMENRGSLAGIPCMVANKISYHLDLRGPSFPVDTACSSSGVALHLAVQAIRAGECEAAVVAGCQMNLQYVLSTESMFFITDRSTDLENSRPIARLVFLPPMACANHSMPTLTGKRIITGRAN